MGLPCGCSLQRTHAKLAWNKLPGVRREIIEREEKSCEEVELVAASTVLQLTQATHKPFDALAVDAWATLAAEMGAIDWLLQRGCSAPNSDHLMTRG